MDQEAMIAELLENSTAHDFFRFEEAANASEEGETRLGRLFRPVRIFFGDIFSFVLGFRSYFFGSATDRVEKALQREIRFGLPAVLGIGASAAFAFFLYFSAIPGRYLLAAREQRKAENYEVANGYYRKLKLTGRTTDEVEFEHAMCLLEMGKTAEAQKILVPMLERDVKRYPDAHVWKARKILSNPKVTVGEQEEALAEFIKALEITRLKPEVIKEYGQLCLDMGRTKQGIEALTSVASTFPELHLELAELHLKNGDMGQADVQARLAVAHYNRSLAATPNDVDKIVRAGRAYVIVKDFEGAEKVLKRGLNLPSGGRIQAQLSLTYSEWTRSVPLLGPEHLETRMELIEKALIFNAQNLDLLRPLLEIRRLEGDLAANSKQFMYRVLSDPKTTLISDILKGIEAWEAGEFAVAAVYLKKAYQAAPNNFIVVGNLAYCLATQPKPELEEAEGLINAALAIAPDNAQLLDTRATIYLKKNNPQEAIRDLESALRINPESLAIRKNLAKAYSIIDAPAIAEIHYQKARELERLERQARKLKN